MHFLSGRRFGLALLAVALPVATALAQVTPPGLTPPAQIPTAVPAQIPNEPAIKPNGERSKWSLHFQQTVIKQWHSDLSPKYEDSLSLQARESAKLSLTTTLFIGRQLWKGGAIFFNPEIAGGSGLSGATGIAGATNGETFRIGDPAPQLYLARLYFQQHWALSDENNEVEDDDDNNQMGGLRPKRYIGLIAGKFSIADFFDQNSYSHDPRTQFLNWSLMSAGGWDYPANTRGYTAGAIVEYVSPTFAVRAGTTAMPTTANGPTLDGDYAHAHAETVQLTKYFRLKGHAGAIRLLGFRNQAAMGSYTLAVREAAATGTRPDIGSTAARNRTKYGFVVNGEQELSATLGIFGRFSYNDGHNETWAFTEIDRSLSLGATSTGAQWHRPADRLGVAVVANGISDEHWRYLNAGGYGFILGDGKLPHYGAEYIGEIYYSIDFAHYHTTISPDYQIVINPGYNRDRTGPVHVVAIRAHVEF